MGARRRAGKGRALVFSLGSPTSGVPGAWAATGPWCQPGGGFVGETARRVANEMLKGARPGDDIVASIHWGGNWGYHVPDEQISFAHRLIDEGVSIVHGHSSHHVKTVEVYHGKLILYGCGDFLSDYEGISGYEQFRGDLTLMYLVEIDPRQGRLLKAAWSPCKSAGSGSNPPGRRLAMALRSSEPARRALRDAGAIGG